MMYIGSSLGGCLNSIMAGEVSKEDVLFIVTRTDCPTYDKFAEVIQGYHSTGNPYSRNPERYRLNDFPLEEVQKLGSYLWYQGKIHQPRVYGTSTGYTHPELGYNLWIEVLPPNKVNIPAVKNAWGQLKMLVSLTQ